MVLFQLDGRGLRKFVPLTVFLMKHMIQCHLYYVLKDLSILTVSTSCHLSVFLEPTSSQPLSALHYSKLFLSRSQVTSILLTSVVSSQYDHITLLGFLLLGVPSWPLPVFFLISRSINVGVL